MLQLISTTKSQKKQRDVLGTGTVENYGRYSQYLPPQRNKEHKREVLGRVWLNSTTKKQRTQKRCAG